MTNQNIIDQLKAYEKTHETEGVVEILTKELEKRNLTIKNVICMFVYNKGTYLELDFLTTPSSNIQRIKILKRNNR